MSQKKRQSPHRQRPGTMPAMEVQRLRRAEELLDQERAAEAQEILSDLDRRFPNNPAVLTLLVNTSYDLKDFVAYEHASERLLRLTPDDPDVARGLAGAYMLNTRPIHALRAFRSFVC